MNNKIWLGPKGNEQLLPAMGRLPLYEEPVEYARENRTASGRLVREIEAVKMTFKISYDIVTNETLQLLKQLYLQGLQQNLNLKIEQEDGAIDEYEVVFRPFGRSRYLLGGKWYWQNITIELEEV